jgi:hypothetical protein
VTHHEGKVRLCGSLRSHNQIAFVLTVFVIHDNDHPARRDGGNCSFD